MPGPREYSTSGRRLGRSLDILMQAEAARREGHYVLRVDPPREPEPELAMASSGRRGCGYRIAGGVYWSFAVPTEAEASQYLLQRPIPIDPQQYGVSPVGVTLMERNGAWHVLDWVGEQHYPSVAHFVGEVLRMGLSRRLPRTMRFDLLDEDSRILLIHRHACGENQPGIFASFPATAIEVVGDVNDIEGTRRRERTISLTTPIPTRVVER